MKYTKRLSTRKFSAKKVTSNNCGRFDCFDIKVSMNGRSNVLLIAVDFCVLSSPPMSSPYRHKHIHHSRIQAIKSSKLRENSVISYDLKKIVKICATYDRSRLRFCIVLVLVFNVLYIDIIFVGLFICFSLKKIAYKRCFASFCFFFVIFLVVSFTFGFDIFVMISDRGESIQQTITFFPSDFTIWDAFFFFYSVNF